MVDYSFACIRRLDPVAYPTFNPPTREAGMCRMLGVMCNDADLLSCAIEEVNESLKLTDHQGHHGLGLGYYSEDDPLLKRQPSNQQEDIDYSKLVSGIESNTLLVHVRRATVGAWKNKNTHPFRFRRWLFAHVGHLPMIQPKQEEILASLPPFLVRNVVGETDSELAFHLFLNNLYTDGTLNDLTLDTELLSKYLREFSKTIDELHSTSREKPTYAIIVTNGQTMGAICSQEPMHYSHREGIHSCPSGDESEQSQRNRAGFKGIMLGARMSKPGHQWREVADRTLITISHDMEFKVQQI